MARLPPCLLIVFATLFAFRAAAQAVWTGYRNLETNAHTDWSVSARETWIRRPTSR